MEKIFQSQIESSDYSLDEKKTLVTSTVDVLHFKWY